MSIVQIVLSSVAVIVVIVDYSVSSNINTAESNVPLYSVAKVTVITLLDSVDAIFFGERSLISTDSVFLRFKRELVINIWDYQKG